MMMQFTLMASELTEMNIAGGSLERRAPEALNMVELKFWLGCRGARGLSKLKKKNDYMQWFIMPDAICMLICTLYSLYNYLCDQSCQNNHICTQWQRMFFITNQ